MSNTLPDATLVSGTWYDAYALTGIAGVVPVNGASVSVQVTPRS